MIRITKEGVIPGTEVYVGTCPHCGTEMEAEKRDLHNQAAGEGKTRIPPPWETCVVCKIGRVPFTPKVPA